MKKTIEVSKNVITSNSRLLKCKEDDVEKLYLAYSRFDKLEDREYTRMMTGEKIITPVMINRSTELVQIIRGVMVDNIYLARTNVEELSSIHPAKIEEFVNIMKLADDVFDNSTIVVDDSFDNGAMITVKAYRSRNNPDATYFLVYEDDINAYKVYLANAVDF